MSALGTVLAYHGVGKCPHPEFRHDCLCVPPDAFARQMAFLARHRQVVRLGDLVDSGHGAGRHTGRPRVAVTFDDGYRNVLEHAAPVLRRYGFPATVFVPTRWIGADNAWEEGGPCHPLGIMDVDELRSAEGLGLSVESHGHAHLDLAEAAPGVVAEDLRASVDRLTEVLGHAPHFLAYPYGRQTATVQAAARAAGFAHAFGFNAPDRGRFARERVSMDGREGRVRFRLKTAGGYLGRRHSRVGTAVASVVRRVVPRPAAAGGA